MKKIKWWIVLVVLLLVTYRLQTTIKPQFPEKFVIPNFKALQQPDGITCGPTSATMLLNYYGISTNVDEIKKLSKTEWFNYKGNPIGLTTPEYLQKAIEKKGLDCRLTHGNLDILKTSVSRDEPCLVLLRSGKTLWHYVVVVGYDERNVLFADPGSGRIETLSNDIFLESWKFSKDMSGVDCLKTCPVCHGTGNFLSIPCDLCGGTGRIIDILDESLHLAEVRPNTVIIPIKKAQR